MNRDATPKRGSICDIESPSPLKRLPETCTKDAGGCPRRGAKRLDRMETQTGGQAGPVAGSFLPLFERASENASLKTLEMVVTSQPDAMVGFLSRIGGITLRKKVEGVLNRLMGIQLMSQMSYAGRRKEKVAFRQSPLCQIVIDSVMANDSNAQISAIVEEIKHMLKHVQSKNN
ncbi:hypothetical protein CAPTEDRAFT_199209 [Capitella teleta]|uniref:DUF4806 domain-containing protein n=1 Tax=Capitella teleta TaxID=283909 RepID=R7V920_CAPTE|nr:hypothetical protein CAPTEDRAFT_199209 [Capitella teleta]|eukprot:ELU15343.1 hypothetical protein CAPTEDRAFT_199209 [Capitella teleta]